MIHAFGRLNRNSFIILRNIRDVVDITLTWYGSLLQVESLYTVDCS